MQQLALLAEASTVLADSMDLAETFDRIATLCVPQIADAVVFWLAREDGPQVVVARHSKAVGQVALERLIDDYAPQLGLGAVDAAMRSGVLQVVRRVTAADVDALVVDETHRLLLQQLELAAGVAVPVVMRRKVLGVVAFAVRQGVELSEETIAFAKELAARLPHAVQNSMLFESATTIAAALQAGLAPSPPPSLESFNIATRYEAAGDGVEIGGDFYDFVDVGANEFVVIVGDVCGRGPSAASLNAQVRFGARALARTGIGPVELATHLNENVVADATDQRFCTAVFAHLSIAESIAAEIVTAGHPSPMILRRDGTVYEIATTGPLLGVFPGATYESTSVIVGQGDTLIMLTDGLLEARDADGAFFEPLLVPLVEGLVGRTVDEIADAITKAVRLFTGGPQLDDIAIVVIQPSTRSDSPKAVQ
jgi:serine phosphatase RsbU (regulator of sigma subunit)